jgi:hypothetical protein
MATIRAGSPFDPIMADWHPALAEPLTRLFLRGDTTRDILLVGAMDRVDFAARPSTTRSVVGGRWSRRSA